MTAPELKPCPFCGGVAEQDHEQSYRSIRESRLGKAVTIYCTTCSASLLMCHEDHRGVDPEDLMAELVTGWNTRTDLHDATKAQLAECEARLTKAIDALTVSANRLAWVTVQFDTGTNNFITVGEWADQACAVLAEIEKGEPK